VRKIKVVEPLMCMDKSFMMNTEIDKCPFCFNGDFNNNISFSLYRFSLTLIDSLDTLVVS